MEQLRVLVAMAPARSLVYLRIIHVDDVMVKAKFNVQDVAAQVKFERKELLSILASTKSRNSHLVCVWVCTRMLYALLIVSLFL